MHKEAQQATGGPTSLGATSEEGAHAQLSSRSNPSVFVDRTRSVGDRLKTDHTTSGANKESRADDISQKVKLEDLSDILKDTRSAFFTPDSPTDESIIISDESEEEQNAKKDKDTEYNLVPPPPSPKSAQIQELMSFSIYKVKFLQFKKSLRLWILFLVFCKITHILNSFSIMMDNASGATSKNVPLVGQATTSPAKGEKNTKDAGTNLKDELIDLLGKDALTQYYTKKLLFDKYYDKMLKRKKNPKITKSEVLTKKGHITLKIYKEDGSNEVISNLKVSDLHLA
nr:hypothetical protein [Tanacetum cinerariifolium]